MFKEVIKPTSRFHNIKIPQELINQELEVVLLPVFKPVEPAITESTQKLFNPKEFYGIGNSTKNEIDAFLMTSKKEWE